MKIFDWLRKTRKKKKDLASAEEYAEIISLDNALNQEKEEKGGYISYFTRRKNIYSRTSIYTI
ncbi:MAG: hypothetical protein E7375_02530 [Clostridiales bacterium]|nr:hypothetical protein [Clostridiales bacterium]